MRISLHRGFTLIELMITVAIVAILAAVAYPSYENYILRSNRSAAQGFLFNVANRQEQQMINARSYFAIAAGTPAQWAAVGITVPQDVSANYTVTVVADNAATPPTFQAVATPIGRQAKDTRCGRLTLTQAGAKGVQNATATADECW